MGNLQFNSQNVTRMLRIANGTANWASNTQSTVPIVQAGYLRELIMQVQAAATITGNPTLDPWGPWSILSNIQINSNVQAGVYNVSGLGAAWIAMLLYGLEHMGNSPDTGLVNTTGVNAWNNSWPYNAPVTATANMFNPNWNIPFFLPLAQKINTLDGFVGIWDLQDPSIQMTLAYTPSSTSTASPFELSNNQTAGTGTTPIFGLTNANHITLTTPSNLLTRVMYDPPLDPQNDPEFGYVSSWYEESWNTALPGSSTINWKALANSGYIMRLLFSVADAANYSTSAATTGVGVADSNLKLSNAILLTVGNNAPVIQETVFETRFRQLEELGRVLPQGVFYIDFLGQDLTMQNILDTFSAGNIQLQMNFNSALSSSTVGGAGSQGKVIRQMLQALMQ